MCLTITANSLEEAKAHFKIADKDILVKKEFALSIPKDDIFPQVFISDKNSIRPCLISSFTEKPYTELTISREYRGRRMKFIELNPLKDMTAPPIGSNEKYDVETGFRYTSESLWRGLGADNLMGIEKTKQYKYDFSLGSGWLHSNVIHKEEDLINNADLDNYNFFKIDDKTYEYLPRFMFKCRFVCPCLIPAGANYIVAQK